MMRNILGVLFVLLIFVSGCSNNALHDDIKVNIGNGENWCNQGSFVNSKGSQGEFKLEVIGIEDNGEYMGMCHMRYEIGTSGEQGIIDYYIDENGNGFQIMNINGEQTKTAWSNAQN